MLLIGSGSPIHLDVRTIAARFADPMITASLSAVGIASPRSSPHTLLGEKALNDMLRERRR